MTDESRDLNNLMFSMNIPTAPCIEACQLYGNDRIVKLLKQVQADIKERKEKDLPAVTSGSIFRQKVRALKISVRKNPSIEQQRSDAEKKKEMEKLAATGWQPDKDHLVAGLTAMIGSVDDAAIECGLNFLESLYR